MQDVLVDPSRVMPANLASFSAARVSSGRIERHTAPGYDVFVSYSHQDPDLAWVRQELVPRLRAAGLRACLDTDSFRLGAPIVLEMGRAAEGSRYTLAVLTPEYLESGFTKLELVLLNTSGWSSAIRTS